MAGELPKRSYATSLTGDELLLLDAIVQHYSIGTKQLTFENYSFHMDTRYSHGISDDRVEDVLQGMKQLGYIAPLERYPDDRNVPKRWDVGEHWAVAELGLQNWEHERGAIWERYVTHWQRPKSRQLEDNVEEESGFELPVLSITSPDLNTAQSCLDAIIQRESSGFPPPRSEESVHIVKTDFAVYELGGRVFPQIHCLFVPTEDDDDPASWSHQKPARERRGWWNTLRDLERLRDKLGLSF